MRLKIVSYNIHKAVGLDRRRDPARILEVLNEIAADVVVLQEADRRLGARRSALPRFLISQETDYRVVDLARTDVSLGWHGNAVLLRPGIEVTGVDHIELPGLEPRGAVRVDLAGGAIVVGTHFGLLRPWRIRQQRAIRDALGAGAARAVVAGDFNEWDPRTGFEPWDGVFDIHAPGRSFHTARPLAALDRFALGDSVKLHSAEVVRWGAARVASDHLPVLAEVTFRG